MRPLKESMDRNTMTVFKGKVKLLLSELKESDAAVLGASALGWEAKAAADIKNNRNANDTESGLLMV